MAILTQFLLRLAFGLTVGMAITSPRQVSSGFFRVHSYVLLGLTTLAALISSQTLDPTVARLAVAAGVFSYFAAVCWLYEAKRLGQAMVVLVGWLSLLAAVVGVVFLMLRETPSKVAIPAGRLAHDLLPSSIVTSGLVLGITTAAMLLGHWYLNSPGMQLALLRRLLLVAALAVVLQVVVCGLGLAGHIQANPMPPLSWWLFLTLRWSFGLVGVAVLLWMAWQTLKIPNTQSATGILYVAVLGVFVGELTGLLLSAESAFPL